MKEQDAAHYFENKETCPTCGNVWGDEAGKFCSNSWHLATPYIMNQLREYHLEAHHYKEELTRLRSELQQERDKVERAFVAGRSKTSWKQFQEDEKAKLNN